MGDLGHESVFVESDNLLESTNQIFLCLMIWLLVLVGEAQKEALMLAALHEDVLVEEQLHQNQGHLGADLQTLCHHLKVFVLSVQGVVVSVLLHLFVDQVDAFFLTQLAILVQSKILQCFSELFLDHHWLISNAVPVAIYFSIIFTIFNKLGT
jgi:hypothetical protein